MKEYLKNNLVVTKVTKAMAFSTLLLWVACKQEPTYDVVLTNCQVYDVMLGEFTRCNVAISEGKVAAMGQESYNAKKVFDASGNYLYPGFIDAHCHFVGYAKGLLTVNLVGAKSFEEVLERTQKFAIDHPKITFISGRGWDQNLWPDQEFPTNERLNALFPTIPVVLMRIDGHAALANEAALQLAGSLPKDMNGGSVVFNGGTPTGMLIDLAVDLIPMPEPDHESFLEALQQAEANCFALGLTSLADAGLNIETINFLDSIQKRGELKMPLYAMLADNLSENERFFAMGPLKTDRLSVRSVKVYGDGALGSRGALLLQSYTDDADNLGLMLKNSESLLALCLKAYKAGFQVNVHAIGDSANRLVLQTFAKVLPTGNDLRWRIEHCQVVNPADGHFFAELGIIPSVQPTHATSDMYWAEKRLGPNRINHAYSFKDLLSWRGKIALGTDFPVEDIDPRKTIYAAVTRQDASGYPPAGFLPGQRLTRQETLRGMTIWAAYAQFEEGEKGSIEVGKWADFFLSSTNLLTCSEQEILKMPINYTWVHGEVVYKKSK